MRSREKHDVKELRLSFNDPDIIPDPYPTYRALRADSPVCFLPILDGAWLFFRYDDVHDLLQDPRLSSNRTSMPLRALPPGQRSQFAEMAKVLDRWVGMKDQPVHLPLRRHLDQVTGIDRSTLRSRIEPVVDDLVGRIPAGQGFDVARHVCYPLPALVISDLLGLPVADHEQLVAWSDDLAYVFGSSTLSVAEVQRAQRSTLALESYIRGVAQHADLPEQALLHRLLQVRTNGFRLTEDEACAQCVQLLFAGLEPTRYAIGNAIHALAQHPEQVALLRREPSLLNGAVEEFLRFDSPVQWIGRLARETFSFRGHVIERGQLVVPYVASANRDPARFSRPESLDIARSFKQHLSFGAGHHHCLGMSLVREQMRLVLQALLQRFSSFQQDPSSPVRWNANLGFHGRQSLTVRFER